MNLSDTLAVLGAVGLAALLDVAVKPAQKKIVSDWLTHATSRVGKVRYGGSSFLDRVFGRAVFLWRSIPRYAIISLISVSLSYFFAILSSPPRVIPAIKLFEGSLSALDVIIIVVCFSATIAGDIVSYAQTRMFVMAIDKSKNSVISAGLVAADVIISLSIFFVMFSIARLICVLLVLNYASTQTLSQTDLFAPAILKSALAKAGVEVGNSDESVTAFAIAIANGRSREELARVSDQARRDLARQFSRPAVLGDVTFKAVRDCPSGKGAISQANEAADQSIALFRAVMAEQARRRPISVDVARIEREMTFEFYQAVGQTRQTSVPCLMEVTSIRASEPAAAFIASAGPLNAWAAAFERTLFDAYSVVGFKLAPYVGMDPYKPAPEYAYSLKIQVQNSFLGAFPIDQDRASLVNYFNDTIVAPEGQVNVPFTPMVASSLATSAFLVLYLLTVIVASMRVKIMEIFNKVLPNFDTEKAVFTTISVAAISMLLATSIVGWILVILWRAILGYLI